MKVYDVILEAPAKKKVAKKKVAKKALTKKKVSKKTSKKKVTKKSSKANYNPEPLIKGDDLRKIVLNQAKTVKDFIKKNCKEWLADTNNGKLYVFRGFDSVDEGLPAFTKAVRPDRRPKDSSQQEHDLLDAVIETCGKVANRTNAAFTTGDRGTAEGYGATYVVLPIGKFNYTWHTKVSDWHTYGMDIESSASMSPEDIVLSQEEIADIKKTATKDWKERYGHLKAPKTKKPKEKKPTLADHRIQELQSILQTLGVKGDVGTTEKAVKDSALAKIWSMLPGYASPKNQWMTNYMMSTLKNKGVLAQYTLNAVMAYREASPGTKKKISTIMKDIYADLHQQKTLAPKKSTHVPSYVPSLKSYIESAIDRYKHDQFDEFDNGEIDFDKVKKKICPLIKGDDGTLKKAITSQNEIMIKCDRLLGVKPKLYQQVVVPMLQGKAEKSIRFDAEYILSQENGDW